MHTTLNKLMNPVRFLAAGTWVALFSVLALCLCASVANAANPAGPPIVVQGTPVLIGSMNFTPPGGKASGGGWESGQSPLGGTLVVAPNGDVIVGAGYGSNTFQITPAGVQSVIAPFNNSDAAGIDSYGNVYIARDYANSIIKLPYIASTGTIVGFTTLPTANCLGGTQDTTPCIFAPGTQATITTGAGSANPGFNSLFFDQKGNFFFVTDTNPKLNPNTIYECSAQCQAETDGLGTYPPVVVYADSTVIGPASVDPWGNIFFSDGADDGANSGKVSNLQELPISGGVYASSPTLITSYTTSAGYNAICGVAADNYGTVYFSVPNDGVFALPDPGGVANPAGIYKASNQGGKGLTVDALGDFITVDYSGTLSGDGIFFTPINNFSLGTVAVSGGTPATATATLIDSAGNCTTQPTLTLQGIEAGVNKTEFSTVAGSSCSTAVGTSQGTFSPSLAYTGADYTLTVTFTPSQVGARTAILKSTDSTNNATGGAALAGVGQGSLQDLDPGVWTSYTTGFSNPQAIAVDAAGNVAVADEGASAILSIPAGATTPVSIGTGFSKPEAVAFDPAGNLFIADSGNKQVEFIPNVSGSLVPSSQATTISSTMTFGGTALGDPTGLAVGPNGVLYISDLTNNRVVTYDKGNTSVFASGLSHPWGIAVDSSNNVYVANTGGGNVMIFTFDGGYSALSVTGITKPWGVAVDASGSLLISDELTGNIVWVPALAGVLTPANAFVVETNPKSAYGIAIDGWGDLYTSDGTGQAVYAIQRTASAINLGTVQNGLTNSGTVWVSVTGNEPSSIASSGPTQSANTFFTLTPANNDGCSNGTSGNPGQACQYVATFAPAVGTANGPQTGTATVNFSPSGSAAVTMTGSATASAVLAQKITGFAPPASIVAGQAITLTSTGGGSGNSIIYTIDAASSCPSCAITSGPTGSTLSGVSAGSVIVDANQAAGTNGGKQYAAAGQVQATITITNATSASVPALTMNQLKWLFADPSGGFTDGQNPQGGSFAITQDGQIVLGNAYGNDVFFVNASTGAVNNTVSVNGPGGIAIDSKNNLYISHLYNSVVYKVPFVNGAFVTWADNPTPAPPACTGTDTVQCTFANSGQNTKAIAFDPSGNFYEVTEPSSSGSGASAIYECTTSCQPTGTGTKIYADTLGISQIAFDPWGNLFFTDANYLISGASDESNSGASVSNLQELVYTAGSGFAASPTTIQTFTTASPGNYDDMLASVAVNATTGTIYYGILNDGTFAIPNSQAHGPSIANQYVVSGQGAKGLITDTHGNIYLVANHSGADSAASLLLGDLVTPGGQYEGAAVTAAATVVDNANGCGKTAALLITSTNSEFSGTGGTTCSSIAVGAGNGTLTSPVTSASSYAATISFAATNVGAQTATLTVSDTANGGIGTATVTGVGLETAQSLTFTAPTVLNPTYSPTLTITVSAKNGGSNNPITFSVDAASTGAGTFGVTTVNGTTSTATLTVTQAGTVVIDANELGGLVNGTFYSAATQAQLTLTVGQASQTIAFPPPATPVTYAPGLKLTIGASGGGSGNAIAFSVDSSSTGSGTFAGNILTVTGAGTIVIDANEAGNVDYLAAPQVQGTIVVNQANQTITFLPLAVPTPVHFIVGGVQIPISATGGGSDNPIVFTVDKSSTGAGTFSTSTVAGATSTATLTITAQGNIVIDANQAANNNYLASTPSPTQETVAVLSPLPTQTITFNTIQTQVEGAPLTLTGTASSGLVVSYSASPSAVCTVSGSTATFVAAGNCTITAMQPGDNIFFAAAPPVSQTFIVNSTGQVPAMLLNLSLGTVTVTPGTVGLTQLTITSQNNFTGTITFACSGQPAGNVCTFTPNPVTLLPDQSTTTTLSIQSETSASAAQHDSRPLFPVATLAVAFCLLGFKKRKSLQMLLLLVIAMAGLGVISGCGGGSSGTTTTPTTTTVTVTATGGGTSTTTSFNLVVD